MNLKPTHIWRYGEDLKATILSKKKLQKYYQSRFDNSSPKTFVRIKLLFCNFTDIYVCII